jgi:hypothetical protein
VTMESAAFSGETRYILNCIFNQQMSRSFNLLNSAIVGGGRGLKLERTLRLLSTIPSFSYR